MELKEEYKGARVYSAKMKSNYVIEDCDLYFSEYLNAGLGFIFKEAKTETKKKNGDKKGTSE